MHHDTCSDYGMMLRQLPKFEVGKEHQTSVLALNAMPRGMGMLEDDKSVIM